MIIFCPYCMSQVSPGRPCPKCGADPASYHPSSHHFPVGHWLQNRYLVGRVLGEGGFGITYLGLDTMLERRVAIKEYFPNVFVHREASVSLDVTCYSGEKRTLFEKGRSQFLQEARVLARLDAYPEIVRVYDFFPANNTAYLVMELLTGKPLHTLLAQNGRIPAKNLFALMEPVLRTLNEVHRAGIIHRDISPDNIMIFDNGQVKLLDFGCARDIDETHTMTVMLKHGFAPIEQYTGHNQGPWTDIYALCATFYYCLTGKLPPRALERMAAQDPLIPPNRLGAALTPEQEQALLRGLAVEPKDRWQNLAELHAALYGTAIKDFPWLPKDSETELLPKQKPVPEPEPEPSDKTFLARIKALPKAAKVLISMIACLAILCPVIFSGALKNEDGVQTAAPASQPPTQGFTQEPAQQSALVPQEETYVYNRSFSDSAYSYTYTGEVSNGIPNGKGTATYDNGNEYVGEFKNGWPNGTGTMAYADGGKYEGEWYDGDRSGIGTMIYADDGDEDDWSGIVTMTYNGGGKYEGEWKDDMRNGTGTMAYVDDSKYEGEWKDDKKNGAGTYKWADGCVFNGEWNNDERNGIGTIVYAGGESYKGEWKNDKKNGIGTWFYTDGTIKYTGEWKDNKFVSG